MRLFKKWDLFYFICILSTLHLHGARLVMRRFHTLACHLEEEQVRQLLHVVAVAHPIVPEDVTIVPKFGYDSGGGHSLQLSFPDFPFYSKGRESNYRIDRVCVFRGYMIGSN